MNWTGMLPACLCLLGYFGAAGAVAGERVVLAAAQAEAEHDAGSHKDAAAAHGEHIGQGNADPGLESPVEVKSDLALFTFLVFLVLLGVLWKFAWGPISAGLEQREHAIAEQIAAAQRAHEEAKQTLAEHQQKLAGTADQIREMLEQARKDAEHAKAAILAEAKAAAEAERARGLRDIAAATDQALKTLAERSANLAVALAGKIVQAHLSPDDHARLIHEAMARFPESEPSQN